MTPPPATLSLWAEILLLIHPWLSRLGIGASGALEIKSAASRIELEGGGRPASGVGHFVTRLAFFPGVPASSPALIWYSLTPDPGPYTWVPLFVCGPTGPLATDPGSVVTISEGSTKVQIDG